MNAPTYIRIPCRSQADAKELALRLQADDYRVARRWKAVIACTDTRDEAELLARRLQSWMGADGARIWETAPQNPATILA